MRPSQHQGIFDPTTDTLAVVGLIPQTGMPPIYFSRSREVLYDALQNEKTFIFNKFGPQRLDLCRPNMHW